jgi:hypothetical protein
VLGILLLLLLLLLLMLLPHQVATPWSQTQAHCSTMQLLAVSAFHLRQQPIHSFLTSAPPHLRRRQQLTTSLPMVTFPQRGMCLPMGTSAYNNKRRVAREFQRCCCAAGLRFTAAKWRQHAARAVAPTAVRRILFAIRIVVAVVMHAIASPPPPTQPQQQSSHFILWLRALEQRCWPRGASTHKRHDVREGGGTGGACGCQCRQHFAVRCHSREIWDAHRGCAGIKTKAMAVMHAALYILLALVKLLVAEIIMAMMSSTT